MLARPKPTRRTARSNEPWRCPLVRMRIAGAPARPFSSTSEAAAREQRVARGRQAGGVRHLAAGDQGEAGAGRQPEHLLQPAAGHLLGDRRRRRAGVERAVLVPRRGQPVGRESRRQGAADHPAEETPAGRAEQAALDVAHQLGHHLLGRQAGVAQLLVELGAQGAEVGGGAHRSPVEARPDVRGRGAGPSRAPAGTTIRCLSCRHFKEDPPRNPSDSCATRGATRGCRPGPCHGCGR